MKASCASPLRFRAAPIRNSGLPCASASARASSTLLQTKRAAGEPASEAPEDGCNQRRVFRGSGRRNALCGSSRRDLAFSAMVTIRAPTKTVRDNPSRTSPAAKSGDTRWPNIGCSTSARSGLAHQTLAAGECSIAAQMDDGRAAASLAKCARPQVQKARRLVRLAAGRPQGQSK